MKEEPKTNHTELKKEDLKIKRIEEIKKEDRARKLREKNHMIESGFFHPNKLTQEQKNMLSPPSPAPEKLNEMDELTTKLSSLSIKY